MTFPAASRLRFGLPLLVSLALLPAASLPLAAQTKLPGVPNFRQVNEMVYRGGQPTEQGWHSLAAMGVTTVIDLCDEHSAASERTAVEAAGMHYVSMPMSGIGITEPNSKTVEAVYALLDHTQGKVFVHCHKGMDRTGTVIAYYRIEHDHWTNKKALHEAESDGMSWMNVGMKRFISDVRATVPATTLAAAAAPAGPAN
ncbi:MAG TPA: sulfur transferase domain-containing protein [Terriglobales bacterium]|nr:sulfur transferase domain-containing protein [Terriglobales bacterium]